MKSHIINQMLKALVLLLLFVVMRQYSIGDDRLALNSTKSYGNKIILNTQI